MNTISFCQDWPESWQRCCMDFLQELYDGHSRSRASQETYCYALDQFFCLIGKLPEEVTPSDVRLWLRTRFRGNTRRPITQPISPGYRRTRLAILSAFYGYAATYMLPGAARPLYDKSLPMIGMDYGKEVKRYRALSEDELKRIFRVIPTDTLHGLRDRAIYAFLFWTARRREEVLRLRWKDVYRSVVVDERGNRRDGWVYDFTGKGHGKNIDTAELPAPAKAALDAYLEASGRMSRMDPDDPLFVPIGRARGEDKPITGHAVWRRLKNYARRAGIDPRHVTVHALRHTAAQMRYAAGSDIREIQHLLRHASLATTDRYLHGLMGSADNGSFLLMDRFRHVTS